MAKVRLVLSACAAGFLTACTGVVFDTGSEGQLYELTTPGGAVAGVTDGEGRQPDVSFDGKRVAFVKPGTGPRQVFVMDIGDPGTLQPVTDDPTLKSYPRWSTKGRLAYVSGSEIIVLNPDFSVLDTGSPPPQTDGSFDFYDNGNKLVYSRGDGLYTVPLDGSTPEMQIISCPGPSVQCGFPIVSHDQTRMAFQMSYATGPWTMFAIHVVSTETWGHLSTIAMNDDIHSHDFSPRDHRLYVAARPLDWTTPTRYGEPVLFVVDLDGSNREQLSPDPPVWNPSTRR